MGVGYEEDSGPDESVYRCLLIRGHGYLTDPDDSQHKSIDRLKTILMGLLPLEQVDEHHPSELFPTANSHSLLADTGISNHASHKIPWSEGY